MTWYLTGAAVLSMCLVVRAMAGQAPEDCHRFKEQELQSHPFLASIIPCTYVKEYRPPTAGGTSVNVEFTMFIQDINSINAADMDFRIDMFLHMAWEEPRLNLTNIHFVEGRQNEHNYITLPAYAIDYIWTPDPYVTNSKDSSITKLTTTYASLTIYSNHTLRYSARVYSIIGCQMEFREYPMDVQTCYMIMRSCKYTKDIWKRNNIEYCARVYPQARDLYSKQVKDRGTEAMALPRLENNVRLVNNAFKVPVHFALQDFVVEFQMEEISFDLRPLRHILALVSKPSITFPVHYIHVNFGSSCCEEVKRDYKTNPCVSIEVVMYFVHENPAEELTMI
ncbi:glycine receptor subunit alpha-4-like [Palaemon carinicauda]|uniref:glycine receptor subunit alpha-4-like n=1 Tax=Palaemon carinicauda TaxID=392227 RepID=UPI0035B65F95